jgi:signal recognition particle GTPase
MMSGKFTLLDMRDQMEMLTNMGPTSRNTRSSTNDGFLPSTL